MNTTGVPAHVLPHRGPRQLFELAGQSLSDAARAHGVGERYAQAHLAALRAAAGVLAARAHPEPVVRRRRPPSVWELLPLVAPELSEWAAFFAAGAAKRSAAEAGLSHVVTARDADDLLRDAERFLLLAQITAGVAVPTSPFGAKVG